MKNENLRLEDKTEEDSQISITISGKGVSPSTVRASDLAELITNFEYAITETAIEKGTLDPEIAIEGAEVSLVGIKKSSNLLLMGLAPTVVDSANEIFRGFSGQETDSIGIKTYSYIKNVHKQSIKMNWGVKIEGTGVCDFGEFVISPVTPFPDKKIQIAKGGTTIYGKLMRLGNQNPTALIVLDDKSRVTVEMTREMVKELEARRRLFHRVGIEGVATWNLKDWKIIEFRAKRIMPFNPTGNHLTKMFEELGKLSEGRWDEIDPVDYVNRLRGRDDQ